MLAMLQGMAHLIRRGIEAHHQVSREASRPHLHHGTFPADLGRRGEELGRNMKFQEDNGSLTLEVLHVEAAHVDYRAQWVKLRAKMVGGEAMVARSRPKTRVRARVG